MNRLLTTRFAAPACAVLLACNVQLAAQTAVPGLMTYQAFVTDASNVPLGDVNPTNFVTTFRIYDSATGNNIVWAEQQTVTIFKGNFSVLLGNGQPVGGEPKPNLDTVFTSADRYIGITVGANPEFTPRQRLLPNAYAYRAKVAEGVGTVLVVNGNNINLAGGFTSNSSSTVNGTLDVNGIALLNDLDVDNGVLGVNPATNTVEIGGTLDANGNLDVDGFSNLDGFTSDGDGRVNGRFGLNKIYSNVTQTVLANAGDGFLLYMESSDQVRRFSVETSGNVISGLVTSTGLVSNGNATVNGSLTLSSTLDANGNMDVDGFTELDGFHSEGWGRVNGHFNLNHGGNSNVTSRVRALPGDDYYWWIESPDGTRVFNIANYAGVHWLEVHTGNAAKPGGGSWAVVSDSKYKKNVSSLEGALDKLLRLRSVNYEYKDPGSPGYISGKQLGFVAQQVEDVFPEWVETIVRKGPDEEIAEEYKVLAIRGFESLTVQSLRELRDEKDRQLDEQAGRIKSLEDDNNALRARLDRIEAQLKSAPKASN